MMRLLVMLALVAGCVTEDKVVSYCDETDVEEYFAAVYDCDECRLSTAEPTTPFVDCVAFFAAFDADTGVPADTDTGSGGDSGEGGDTATASDDVDGDGYTAQEAGGDDCDDGNSSVHPNAAESCDGVDNDCNGSADDNAGSTWYADADEDGYGNPDWYQVACVAPMRYVSNHDDCDDMDPAVTLGSYFYRDADEDGYGVDMLVEADDIVLACSAPDGYASQQGDCNDADAVYNPGATELDCADPEDYNCDGSTGYADADADGWAACEECNDANAAVRPNADEWCNGVDDDCDGRVDTDNAIDANLWYFDGDVDGFGDPGTWQWECSAPATSWVEADLDGDGALEADEEDCNDEAAGVNPGAAEECDSANVDEDCDGLADDADPGVVTGATTWYYDHDRDGYGDPAAATIAQCEQPANYVDNSSDCNDLDESEPAIDACD